MDIRTTTSLTENQKRELYDLQEKYRQKERGRLTFPVEDGDFFCFLYDGCEPVCALSLYFTDDETCECMAYTLPSLRNQGYFGRLLEKAIDYMDQREEEQQAEITLCFPSDEACSATRQVLQCLEAEFWYSELQMGLSLQKLAPLPDGECPVSVRLSDQKDGPALILLDSRIIGRLYWQEQAQNLVYLYSFQMEEKYRGKGLGGMAFLTLLHMLRERQVTEVRLQVSGQNKIALHLYQKTGFQILETLSYYCY